MNKIIITTFVALSVLLSATAYGQEGRGHGKFDKASFLARKNAYITAEVGLTPDEAAQFIPLCNELWQKTADAGKECRKLNRQMRTKSNPTDTEYTEVVDICLNARIRGVELEKEYFEKFKKILSPEKLYKYKEAEHRFMGDFMKEAGGRREK